MTLLGGWEVDTLFILQSKVHAFEKTPHHSIYSENILKFFCHASHSMAASYPYKEPLVAVILLPCTHMILQVGYYIVCELKSKVSWQCWSVSFPW